MNTTPGNLSLVQAILNANCTPEGKQALFSSVHSGIVSSDEINTESVSGEKETNQNNASSAVSPSLA